MNINLNRITTVLKRHWRWIVVLLALSLRLILVFHEDFWEDELWSYHYITYYHSVVEYWLKPLDDRAPLYYPLMNLIPDQILHSQHGGLALRLMSFIMSFSGSAILYIVLRRVNQRLADIWLLILSFSLDSVQYA